jgi:hypothetical protein
MKTIITSVLAITITATSFANPSITNTPTDEGKTPNNITEPKEGKKEVAVAADFTKESEKLARKMERVADKNADINGQLNYKQSMAALLNIIEVEKHNNRIENLHAELHYNSLMTRVLVSMEQEKLNNTLDDIKAGVQYATIMESILDIVGSK